MRVFISAILAAFALFCLAAILLLLSQPAYGNVSWATHISGGIPQQGTYIMTAQSLTILMLFAIPLAAIIGGILLAALKILKGNEGGRGGESDREETRLIQELHRGLQRMEERVDALETLLLDKSTHRKTHD